MPDDRNTVNEGHLFFRGEDGAEVEGHIRKPHMLDEDSRPSSPAEAPDALIEDDGPDVEGHGHTYHGHTYHGHTHHEPKA